MTRETRGVQALKIAGFLDALAGDLNDELTVILSGLYVLVMSPRVQADSNLLPIVQDLILSANRIARRSKQAQMYAIHKKGGR